MGLSSLQRHNSIPEITVVLCTRNRAESLARCLSYYEQIRTHIAWELLVIDNGSSDETSRVLERQVARGMLPLVTVSEPAPGLSNARNTGLRHAAAPIICFSDDDCYPDPSFIDAWRTIFLDPSIDYGGGRIELFDPTDAHVTIKTDPFAYWIPPRSFVRPGSLHGASLAFRRRVVEVVGRFDPALGAGAWFKSAEDIDYVQRASEAGFTGIYSPQPIVLHHHGRKPSDVAPLMKGYDLGRGAFYAGILSREPRILWRAIADDFRGRPGLLRYARSLVRRCRDRFPQRIWNVTRGIVQFTILQAWRTDKHCIPQAHIARFKIKPGHHDAKTI
jgi:glycosyltransferase involved in cell wall biosynthesis